MKHVLLFVMLLALAACSKQDAPTIATWQGTGITDTETFTVRGRSFRVAWWRSRPADPVAGAVSDVFSVAICKRGEPAVFAWGAMPGSPDRGQTLVQGAGEFYCKVLATPATEWELTIERGDQK